MAAHLSSGSFKRCNSSGKGQAGSETLGERDGYGEKSRKSDD